MSNSGRKKSKVTYTTPSAAQWRASFDANQVAQEQAYSTPYNNGTVNSDVTSIYNLPQSSTYKQDYLPSNTEVDNESKGFWANAWDATKHLFNATVGNAIDGVKPLFDGSAVRMMFQNLYNTRTTQYEEELRKTYSDLEDTEIADKYVDLIRQYKQAKDSYDKMGLIVDEARMKDLEKQLDVMENIIRRSSKSSDVLLDLFADSSKDQKL